MVTKDEVVWAYRMILGREPENDQVVDQHVTRFGNKNRAFLRKEFLASPEINLTSLNKVDHIHVLENEPSTYVSLGTHCYASNLLKEHGRKKSSYPFDWIFSSPEMIMHCIDTDFSVFLDKAYFLPIEEKHSSLKMPCCNHGYYLEHFGIPRMFNHHNPVVEEDYHYYQRCVDRFRQIQKSTEEIRFVMVARRCSEENFKKMVALLANGNASVVCVQVDDSLEKFGLENVLISGKSKLLRYSSISKWVKRHPLKFDDPFDDLLMAKLLFGHIP